MHGQKEPQFQAPSVGWDEHGGPRELGLEPCHYGAPRAQEGRWAIGGSRGSPPLDVRCWEYVGTIDQNWHRLLGFCSTFFFVKEAWGKSALEAWLLRPWRGWWRGTTWSFLVVCMTLEPSWWKTVSYKCVSGSFGCSTCGSIWQTYFRISLL